MSRLPGTPLRGTTVTVHQTEALAEAVRSLYAAVPADVVEKLPARTDEQARVIGHIHTWHGALRTSGAAPEVREALRAGLRWLTTSDLERRGPGDVPAVFGPGDGNLANYLWDGSRVRIVDFEVSGRSDRALEIAEITEHVSSWTDGGLDVDLFVSLIDLTSAETTRLLDCRRLLALVWLCMLALDHSDPPRNPPGTAEGQAHRLLQLLG
jgi:thiamine kinase-like enzyme